MRTAIFGAIAALLINILIVAAPALAQADPALPSRGCGEQLDPPVQVGFDHWVALRDQGMTAAWEQIGDSMAGEHWSVIRDAERQRWAVIQWMHDSSATLCVMEVGIGPEPPPSVLP